MALKQIHNKFKIFTGALAADKTIGALADQITSFAAEHKIAAKSIGVEYLESAKKLIITLGYREAGADVETYGIKVNTVSLGKINGLESGDVSRLEAAMTDACEKIDNIICHELYITDDGDFLVVFMSRA